MRSLVAGCSWALASSKKVRQPDQLTYDQLTYDQLTYDQLTYDQVNLRSGPTYDLVQPTIWSTSET